MISIEIKQTPKNFVNLPKARLVVPKRCTVADILTQLGVSRSSVLTAVNDELVDESFKFERSGQLTLISAISGG